MAGSVPLHRQQYFARLICHNSHTLNRPLPHSHTSPLLRSPHTHTRTLHQHTHTRSHTPTLLRSPHTHTRTRTRTRTRTGTQTQRQSIKRNDIIYLERGQNQYWLRPPLLPDLTLSSPLIHSHQSPEVTPAAREDEA